MKSWWLPVLLPIIISSCIGALAGIIGFSWRIGSVTTGDHDYQITTTQQISDLKAQVNQNTSDIVILKGEYSAQSQQLVDILAGVQDIRSQIEKLLFMREKS